MRGVVVSCGIALWCAGCVGRGAHDEVVADRDALRERVTHLERQALDLRSERDRARAEAAAARAIADAASKRAREAEITATRRALGLGPEAGLSATLVTDLGDIECALWVDVAPVTVRAFVELAEGTREWTDPRTEQRRRVPLYDGTVFHRVLPGFMIQGGDPRGDGSGGPGFTFDDEIDPDVAFDQPGLLAMANTGPDTNGSQFFITAGTPRHLDGKHTIFGRCDPRVVDEIASQPVTRSRQNPDEVSRPVEPVTLRKVRVDRG